MFNKTNNVNNICDEFKNIILGAPNGSMVIDGV